MPRSRTVLKRQRQTVRRTARNRAVRSNLRTLERKVREAEDADSAALAATAYQKALDRAAAHGVVHPNKAARKKSRLSKHLARSST